MPDGVRWRRIFATSVVLACLGSASILGSLWWLRPRPEPGPRPFPTRLATDREQQDILAASFDRFLRDLPPPASAASAASNASDAGLRPLVVIDTSLQFCGRDAADSVGNCALSMVEESIASPRWEIDFRGAPDIPLRFRTALIDSNRRAYPQPMPRGRKTIPVSTQDMRRSLQYGFWKGFYERFPRSIGVVDASRAVVSEDGREALIYIEHRCDGLCGTGILVLMSRIDGRWRITDPYVLWIS